MNSKREEAKALEQELSEKGRHGTVETIIVEGEDGPKRINKADFDPETHKEVKGFKPKPAPAAVAAPVGKPAAQLVPEEAPDFNAMSKAELAEYLTAKGVAFTEKANKAALIELAEAAAK